MKKNSVWAKVSFFVGVPASAITILLTFDRFFKGGSPDAKMGMLLLSVFAACFLIYTVIQEFRYSRKTRYAEAMHQIFYVFRLCMECTLKKANTEIEIIQCAEQICDQLANAFSLITGTKCAACIKILESNPAELIDGSSRVNVSTLCRDSGSIRRQANPGGDHHWIDMNTDFDVMFKTIDKPEGGTFIAKNLVADYNYNNTSFSNYGGHPKEIQIPLIRYIVRHITWPLPYKSTVGAVIYPINPSGDDQLVGFLCADSASRGVFKKRYDVDLIRAISGALYPIMMKWSEIIKSD